MSKKYSLPEIFAMAKKFEVRGHGFYDRAIGIFQDKTVTLESKKSPNLEKKSPF